MPQPSRRRCRPSGRRCPPARTLAIRRPCAGNWASTRARRQRTAQPSPLRPSLLGANRRPIRPAVAHGPPSPPTGTRVGTWPLLRLSGTTGQTRHRACLRQLYGIPCPSRQPRHRYPARWGNRDWRAWRADGRAEGVLDCGAVCRASRDPVRMMSPHRQGGVVTVVDVGHRRDAYRTWASSAFLALLNCA